MPKHRDGFNLKYVRMAQDIAPGHFEVNIYISNI